MSLDAILKAAKESKKSLGPVWEGPSGDGANSGVTYSLLCRFLTCRERFRILTVKGLRAVPAFDKRLEYGQMWHECEAALARGGDPTRGGRERDYSPLWFDALVGYARRLGTLYPLQREQIDHWYNACRIQFPIYVAHWAKHHDVRARIPVAQEEEFSINYKLPSGRLVRLRGKFDSVDIVEGELWLQENKTKGEVDEATIRRQLSWDLQTMLYLTALREWKKYEIQLQHVEIKGIRYNVVKRPFSGGKGNIVRHKATKTKPAETKEHYYNRLGDYITAEPDTYFARWNIDVSEGDIDRFRAESLDPILENLVDYWAEVSNDSRWVKGVPVDYKTPMCWRHPYGVYNVLNEGGFAEIDYYMDTGSSVGLGRVDNLFPELS